MVLEIISIALAGLASPEIKCKITCPYKLDYTVLNQSINLFSSRLEAHAQQHVRVQYN